jgi:hypothetical protein
MMRTLALAWIGSALLACGPSARGDDNPPVAEIELDPPDLTITIVDGVAIAAVLRDAGRPRRLAQRVTSTAVFAVTDASFGWSGADRRGTASQ